MINLLLRIFIKDYKNYADHAIRQKYGMLSGALGIFLNVCLFSGKFLAGTLTGSIAITADAFNNLSDAASSIVTLLGFKMAGQQPDNDHPFGHGRIEYLAGLIVSMAILLMGFELGKSSVQKIMSPATVEFSWLSIGILAVSIFVKFWMASYNRTLGKKISSATMHATALDSLSDCVATSTVLVGSLIAHYFSVNIDAYLGICVALFILYTGFNAAKDTISPLLGQAPDAEFVRDIMQTVMAFPGITAMHDLIIHDYGPGRCMICFHAEVPCNADILEMHDIIDDCEHALKRRFDCDAVIHMDPIATNDERTCAKRAEIAALCKLIDESVSIHDFRMTAGSSHTNLIFDVVVPHKFRLSDEQVRTSIQQAVASMEGNYYAVVNVDKLYT